MHARIDALTHPHFWSLLPSIVFDWVVIIVSVPLRVDARKHTETSHERNLEYSTHCPHRTDLLSVGAHEHCSGCTGFTSSGSVSPPRATHHPPTWHTSQFLVSLGGHQLIKDGPIRGRYSTLVKTQVCKCVVRQDEVRYVLSYQESWQVGLRRLILGNTRLSGYHTHPTALGYSECYTLLSHCALPHKKLKPSTSEDMHLFQETLNPFPEVLSILRPGFE